MLNIELHTSKMLPVPGPVCMRYTSVGTAEKKYPETMRYAHVHVRTCTFTRTILHVSAKHARARDAQNEQRGFYDVTILNNAHHHYCCMVQVTKGYRCVFNEPRDVHLARVYKPERRSWWSSLHLECVAGYQDRSLEIGEDTEKSLKPGC